MVPIDWENSDNGHARRFGVRVWLVWLSLLLRIAEMYICGWRLCAGDV